MSEHSWPLCGYRDGVVWRRIIIQGGIAVILMHAGIAAVIWACGIESGAWAAAFAIGSGMGVALIWSLYYALRFCLWLRKKQVEGDHHD